MTKIFFVRHAQPDFSHEEDMTRPLTKEGMSDRKIVLETLKDKQIDVFYCSPYLRSVTTIQEVADFYSKEIHLDDRLREREKGADSNNHEMFHKRWANHELHEPGGESIRMVQERNIAALKEILDKHAGENIVIGTHGTAFSSIMNYYNPQFGCNDFLRIIDWMPYVVEVDFLGQELLSVTELAHIEKVFDGKGKR